MISLFKKSLLRLLVFVLLVPSLAFAQVLPASKMQSSIAGLIQNKMSSRGFATNDPRWNVTLQGAGSSIAGAAAAAAVVTAAGVTAPAWITAAATVALGSLMAYGIDLAVDGIRWLINGDGAVTYTPSAAPQQTAPDSGGAMVAGGAYYQQADIYGGSGANVAKEFATLYRSGQTFVAGHTDESGNYWFWVDDPSSQDGHCAPYAHCESRVISKQSSGAPGNCAGGMVYVSSCRALTVPGGSPTPAPVTKTASEAVSSLSDSDKAKLANPELLAQIADSAWKNAAAQPDYQGVPYDAANPISASDAAAYQQSNPGSWPTVGDVVAPNPSSSGASSASPWSLPSSAPATNPNPGSETGTGTEPKPIEWGVFSPPVLEATPTIESILDPLFNLFPAWSSFSFPAHQSVCPTPSFSLPQGVLNGHTLHFTQMCDFLEANNVRTAMQAAFAVAWAILIIFIVMGA